MQVSANDPTRLLGKGVRGDPGRLLREEKTRKRIAKEKPKVRFASITGAQFDLSQKLESDLHRIIPEWERERGQPFLVNGARFLDDLAERTAQEAAGKENKRVRFLP